MTQSIGARLSEVTFRKLELATEHAPTPAQRKMLETRRAELNHALDAPATKLEREKIILEMIMAFRIDMQDDVDAWALNYIEALDGMPLWAIDKARRIVMRGGDERKNMSFMPTPPEFVRTVEGLVTPLRQERHTIHRILIAEVFTPPTEEERARVAARVKAVVSGMAARAEEQDRTEKEAEFRKREAIEEAARQAAASAAARQSDLSPSSPEAVRSSSPETHSASE